MRNKSNPENEVQSDAEKNKQIKSVKKQKVDAALQNFTNQVQEPPKKKHGWVSMLVLLLIIGLGIFFMVKLATSVGETEIRSLGDILANLDVKYTLISVAVLVGMLVLDSVKYLVVTHATTGLFKPLSSIKVSFLGKYYDNITPFGSGGQPMQILYLHKKGHSAGVSSAIVMIKYFAQMICWLLLCFLLMTFNRGALQQYVDAGQQQFFMIAGWIGWVINALLPFFIIFFAIFPKITNKILLFFINIVTKISWSFAKRKEKRTGEAQLQRKIKILRRKQKWINSAYSAVKDFRSSFIVMSHKPVQFILLMLVCLASEFFTWSFPYFILVAFADGAVEIGAATMFAIMTLNAYASMSVSIVPTPGNSGVLENVIVLVFRALATSVVFWVVFAWRFFTYYIYILIGIGITVFELIRKAVRNKRESK